MSDQPPNEEQTMDITTVRKDRRSRVTDMVHRGPTHRVNVHDLTWCGRKIRGLARWQHHATPADVDCTDCQRAINANQPRPWKR